MNLGLLAKIFGTDSAWHGPCLVLLDTDASVNSTGPDSIMSGGSKSYAPRIPSGRVQADAICYSPEQRAVLIIQRTTTRKQTGEHQVQEMLMVVDISHLVGLQFETTSVLDLLNISHPNLPGSKKYTSDMLVG